MEKWTTDQIKKGFTISFVSFLIMLTIDTLVFMFTNNRIAILNVISMFLFGSMCFFQYEDYKRTKKKKIR